MRIASIAIVEQFEGFSLTNVAQTSLAGLMEHHSDDAEIGANILRNIRALEGPIDAVIADAKENPQQSTEDLEAFLLGVCFIHGVHLSRIPTPSDS